MYTIIKASELLNTSKVTLYRHMEKNGIKKGSKLSDEQVDILRNSIGKSKQVTGRREDISLIEKELTYKINQLELIVKEKDTHILQLERKNNDLLHELQKSQILVNESQKQNIELLANSQKLLEYKETRKPFWKR